MGNVSAKILGLKAAPMTIETSIRQQLEVIKRLTPQNNGEFLNHDGKIAW